MRKPIISGNWKMYKTATESAAFARELAAELATVDCEVIIFPNFTALVPTAAAINASPISLGAQNMHWETQGAFTGEVSPTMLSDAGCSYVLLGHSERRQYFDEVDQLINKKAHAALAHQLIPVICVGETLVQREANQTQAVVGAQVAGALAGIAPAAIAKLVIAYEPVWAIGTGRTSSAAEAQQVCRFIRDTVAALAGTEQAKAIRIQYGGSVKPDNIDQLMAEPDIDGVLVGGASLEVDAFCRIVRYEREAGH